MKRYTPLHVHIHKDQENRLKRAIQNGGGARMHFSSARNSSTSRGILCLTKQQIAKVEKAPEGTSFSFPFSAAQIKANMSHKGGFLSLLAAVLAPLLGGVIGGLAEKAIGGSLETAYEHHHQPVIWRKKNLRQGALEVRPHGKGLFLTPYGRRLPSSYGSGLFLSTPYHHAGDGLFKRIRSKSQLPHDHHLRAAASLLPYFL